MTVANRPLRTLPDGDAPPPQITYELAISRYLSLQKVSYGA